MQTYTATAFFQLISAYKNAHDTTGVTVPLNAAINRIRDGSRDLDEKTKYCYVLAHTDKDKYRDYKAKTLPAVTFSGTFPRRKRRANQLQQHSGLITLDIDDLPANTIPDLLATLVQMPQVALAFVSPSAEGIKAIVPVNPIPRDADEHKGAYAACREFFDDLATEYDFQVDTSGSDCSRLCFLAHDPLVIVNENPTPIQWDPQAIPEPDSGSEDPSTNPEFHGDVDLAALDYISPDADYDIWLGVGFACYNSGVSCEVWDNWSQKGSKYKAGDCDKRWQGFGNYTGRKITWATVVQRAKENGYVPKHFNSAQRLLANAPAVKVRETPSFRHFSQEERAVVSGVLSLDPNAGWHGKTPIFTTRYEYLYPLTEKFKLNGQPSDVEKRRVWSTLFGNCQHCGAATAQWVDRYLLTAGIYCDGCHKDYHLGSYLELELARQLPNSIDSDYQGFLGDDPDFADFRLWEPRTLTHLGAGMSTGKSTETYKQMTRLATQGLGKGIIAVPRVSLARFLAHYLRQQHGDRSWGLWHEGCHNSDKFIGDFGAIVCMPSLQQAVKSATDAGVKRLYIAIDELDFSYNLLSLAVEQATKVKKCLRDALASTGLVVAGQTESTLALEALVEELEAEQVQGFYNTAKHAAGHVLMHKHPNINGKSNAILCGVINNISDTLSAGHNAYTFCSSRRDADIIADEFQRENPVIYNAYTKGDRRADAVLKNQRLTDSRIFLATSAAGVGISILDPKARTIIASGLTYGSRDASMIGQKCVRDRRRCGIDLHYVDYQLSLPLRPTENEKVSLYHEQLKQELNIRAHLSEAGVKKIAHAQALASLADTQIQTFISHHLGTVGNMPVYHASALDTEPERIATLAARRSELRRTEREKRITTAIHLLQQRDILTTSEIRVLSNQGRLSTDGRLAHETANAIAHAVGWNEKTNIRKDVPDAEDLDVAIRLTQENINTEKLKKQRRGYLAVNFPVWTAHQFQANLEQSDSQLIIDGMGIEITAIDDDRFLGEFLTALLDRLTGKTLDSASLAIAVREVLQSRSVSRKTFGSEISSGALGASAYRKARFLHIADDDRVVDWARNFIAEWYPARIAKNREIFTLCHAEHSDLRLAAFSRWLMHQPSVPDGTEINLDLFPQTQPPDPNTDRKTEARKMRKQGATLAEIAAALRIARSTASEWCKGITPEQENVSERTARRRSQKQRVDAKAELTAKAKALIASGLSQTQTAKKLGISRKKLKGLIA